MIITVFVDDVRFPNEYQFIEKFKHYFIKVTRPNNPFRKAQEESHVSEHHWITFPATLHYNNIAGSVEEVQSDMEPVATVIKEHFS